ncbi:MAG: DUF1566 domain-containing protein [Desulfobulbaceae bacterium]|nr:DUF1566 domain-containing protein [Desulfobulbaceae bacterium]
MNRTIQVTACIIALVFGIVSLIQADETVQGGEHFIKLDSQGQKLSTDAGQWAMVLDTSNGLIWEVKTTDGSIHDMQAGYDWDGAHEIFLAELNRMTFGGFSDWRLPTTDELRTIKVKGTEPYINQDFFPNTVPSSYLSWRKCGSGEIFDERVKFGKLRNKKANRLVRAVRGSGIEQAVEKK